MSGASTYPDVVTAIEVRNLRPGQLFVHAGMTYKTRVFFNPLPFAGREPYITAMNLLTKKVEKFRASSTVAVTAGVAREANGWRPL